MALPKINVKQHSLNLPSDGRKVIFRPFTVKEEKILLQALDEDDDSQIRALRQVMNNCLIPDANGNVVDVNTLPMFDLDYLWLKVRAKSVQEIVQLPFECRNALPDGETRTDDDGNVYDYCGTVVNVAINLDTIEVKKNPENDPKIDLQDGIGVLMCYPTFETVQKLALIEDQSDVESMFEIIMDCIVMIYDGERTYEREHIEKPELLDFLESLPGDCFAKIQKFFETLPVLRHQLHFRCPKCKHEVDVVIEGTKSFLASDSPTNQ